MCEHVQPCTYSNLHTSGFACNGWLLTAMEEHVECLSEQFLDGRVFVEGDLAELLRYLRFEIAANMFCPSARWPRMRRFTSGGLGRCDGLRAS